MTCTGRLPCCGRKGGDDSRGGENEAVLPAAGVCNRGSSPSGDLSLFSACEMSGICAPVTIYTTHIEGWHSLVTHLDDGKDSAPRIYDRKAKHAAGSIAQNAIETRVEKIERTRVSGVDANASACDVAGYTRSWCQTPALNIVADGTPQLTFERVNEKERNPIRTKGVIRRGDKATCCGHAQRLECCR